MYRLKLPDCDALSMSDVGASISVTPVTNTHTHCYSTTRNSQIPPYSLIHYIEPLPCMPAH